MNQLTSFLKTNYLKMIKIKKVLITGITGFVGSHLVDYYLKNCPDVKIWGLKRWRSPMYNLKHIEKGKISFYEGDLTDLCSMIDMIEKIQPDVIFHLAAQSYVLYSFSAPLATLEVNIIGTANLLEAVRIAKQNPIIHVCSSSEVYGQVDPENIPIKENCPLNPASPYATGKVGEDMLALQYWNSYKIRTIRTRMFTHTGPRRGEVFCISAFARQIALIEKGKQEKVLKVGNLESVRTFADVRDAVKAYWLLVNKCRPGEVYNIGGDRTMKVGEALNMLLELSPLKKEIKIEIDPALLRPADVTLQIPDCSKFNSETSWKPEIPFEKTLEDTLNYWRS